MKAKFFRGQTDLNFLHSGLIKNGYSMRTATSDGKKTTVKYLNKGKRCDVSYHYDNVKGYFRGIVYYHGV